MCLWRPEVNARFSFSRFLAYFILFFFVETASLPVSHQYRHQPVNTRHPPVSPPAMFQRTGAPQCLAFLLWVLGREHRPCCMASFLPTEPNPQPSNHHLWGKSFCHLLLAHHTPFFFPHKAQKTSMGGLLTAFGLLCPPANYGKFVRRALWGNRRLFISCFVWSCELLFVSTICY